MPQAKDDFFNEENEAKSNWFKFEKPGDLIKGKFVSSTFKEAKDNFQPQYIYEIENDDGVWMIPIAESKKQVVSAMKRAQIGQLVGFSYTDDYINDAMKKKGMNPSKTIKCFMEKNFDALSEMTNGEASLDDVNLATD